ncbi:hypothetical protein ACFSTH_02905 [Paenibacillus yanchengensis]|uniref:XRE family transcriptional regulator n=1 Tax=Paenibacillus yanchengensis TaxID=2035833 RepID=A0ABW4YGH6_9BACL
MSQKQITPLGWKIMVRLAEQQLTRKQFCEQEGIPESRLSNLITGLRPAKKYRQIVIEKLNIQDEFVNS